MVPLQYLYNIFNRSTLGQFAYKLSQLALIDDELYPEFFDIKIESMKLTKRYIELENKTDLDSVREMQMIKEKFEELDYRLNVLLGNILVNKKGANSFP